MTPARMNAEVAQGGLRVNMIPREGGNPFSGSRLLPGRQRARSRATTAPTR